MCDPQQDDGDESAGRDSCSEHSSSTSTSTQPRRRAGHCDCCCCEFFGLQPGSECRQLPGRGLPGPAEVLSGGRLQAALNKGGGNTNFSARIIHQAEPRVWLRCV